ncbi:hypothetical protein GLUCOINTEAF2_0203810 [Komagataeibacter intermedius AF2]|uniref:Uncharacterized protein n=1 Tax=Komagataeibacter intermedius AF2 TaxID=1458464 RepID=A0A0N1FC54_9PROT|nr:hypothetical protein GLUCOINTEAF2_0203810 [Komagataeibacter intermedius AF2]
MGCNHTAKGFGVSGLADMPVMQMRQLAQGGTLTGVGHACQTKINPIRQDHRQQGVFVIRDTAGTAMGKAVGEADPAVHFQQKISNLDPWQPVVSRPPQLFHSRGCNCFQRRNHKTMCIKPDL